MKAVNVVLGFILFAVISSLMFGMTFELMNQEKVEGASDFQNLAGEYEQFSEDIGGEDSTARGILDQTKQGAAESEDKDTSLLKGAVSGGRLVGNFYGNFENIVHNATGNINQGGSTFVDQRLIRGILIMLMVFLVFVVLHFLRGFKTET